MSASVVVVPEPDVAVGGFEFSVVVLAVCVASGEVDEAFLPWVVAVEVFSGGFLSIGIRSVFGDGACVVAGQ